MRTLLLALLLVHASASDSIVLADFETDADRRFEAPPDVTIVAEHAHGGKRALKLVQQGEGYPGLVFQDGGDLRRFRERPVFAVEVFNPGDAPVAFSVRADDAKSKDYGSRYNDDGYVARPGWTTVRINLTGLLRSNSRNFHEQDPLDLATLRLFNLFLGPVGAGGPRTLYFDDARLEGTGLPEVAGLRAFDFGPSGSGVFSGFVGATEKDVYDQGRGWGWRGPFGFQRPGNPDDLGGDYGCGDGFVVDVAPGTWVVQLGIDTFGAWAGPQAIRHRTVAINGRTALDETWTGARFLAERYLRFEADEDDPGIDLWERRVKPATPIRRFEAEVGADGKLEIAVRGDGPHAAAMCFLVAYPKAKAEEGDGFMRALEARRRELYSNEITVTVPKAQPAPEPTAAERAAGWIAFARDADSDVSCGGAPAAGERPAALALAGCAGERLSAQVGLMPLRAVEKVTATVGELAGPGGARIPAAAAQVRVVRHFAKRNGISRNVTLDPLILRPGSAVALRPGFTRAFWLTLTLPADAKPGDYRGAVTLTGGGATMTVPLTLTVHPFALDPADDATFSCTGTTAGHLRGIYPDLEAGWWTTAEAMMRDQAAHGLNAVTGGPGMGVVAIEGGAAKLDFTDADRWLALAARYGLTRRGDSYQGLEVWLGFPIDTSGKALAVNEQRAQERWHLPFADVVRLAYAAVAAHAAERGWPPRSYALLDEPRPEFGNIEECGRLIQLFTTAAPGTAFSGFYSPGQGRDPYFATMPISIAHHTAASIRACVDAGKEAWDYSGGGSRYDAGRWFFALRRAGVTGFLRNGWMYVGSDPWFDFADTEGSWAQVYPSADGFVATTLWERTATGIADYRYLKTLAARIAAAKAAGRDAAAAEAFLARTLAPIKLEDSGSATLTPAGTAAFRAELARLITALGGR